MSFDNSLSISLHVVGNMHREKCKWKIRIVKLFVRNNVKSIISSVFWFNWQSSGTNEFCLLIEIFNSLIYIALFLILRLMPTVLCFIFCLSQVFAFFFFPVLSLLGLIKIFQILLFPLLLLMYTLYCLSVTLVIWTLDILDSHLNDKFCHFSDNIITLKHFTLSTIMNWFYSSIYLNCIQHYFVLIVSKY